MTRPNDKDADPEKEGNGAGSDPPKSPFEVFEEFARKVISVPRATIEERERAYRENRDRLKEKPS
ncbi:MAG: hypothetical protein QOH06_2904 [Acidobacteriota bacterium]|jgi:hypothetical protein|nr:hypothetical protein [Acidobacteriota bacterium]